MRLLLNGQVVDQKEDDSKVEAILHNTHYELVKDRGYYYFDGPSGRSRLGGIRGITKGQAIDMAKTMGLQVNILSS